MAALFWFTEKVSRLLNVIAYAALTFIMLLTVSDVILRMFKLPIIGTFELVGLAGVLVIGFGMPLSSWLRGFIFVDFLINMFPKMVKDAINVITRVASIVLFILIGWNLFVYASDLSRSGEGTLTLQLPFYPIAYGLGVVCFFQCLVLFTDIVKIFGGKYE